jgi:tyrosyl-tRNA synthetase
MSQSIGNYIGVEDPPAEMFGKTMSIPDQVMPEWFRLAADVDPEEVERIEAGLARGELHPGEVKRRLARAVTALYWGDEAAGEAEAGFDQVFRHGGTPDEIEDFSLPPGDTVQMSTLVREVSGESGSEARRLLAQGAVRLDGEVVSDGEMPRNDLSGRVLKVGKRRFVRLSE